ncbi:MAG TPA: TolC family protein [Cyclobacteriaceae bacterium]|nr:TolC family protein [Cyclobacteriaceae bacterium]
MRKHKALLFLVFISFFGGSIQAQEQITLDQVITLALEKNYDIQLSKNTSKSAAIDNSYSVGLLLPQVNAVGSTTWNKTEQEFIFANETQNRKGTAKSDNMAGSLQLVWTLFDGTKMFATRERLAELAAQGELNVKDQMVNSIAAVINGYYSVVRQKQQLVAIRELMSINEERVKLAEKKLQVGTGGKPELLQAKVDLNANKTLLIQQETLIIQLKDILNGLVGLQLPIPYDVSDSIIINLDLKQEEIGANIETKNFALQSSLRSLNVAQFSLRESRAGRSPVLNFNAAYNYNHTNNTQLINPFSSLETQTSGYNYGLSISLPILNGFNITRNIQQSKINFSRQQLLYDQLKQTTDINVRNAYVNYDNAKKVLLLEEENILLAKENVVIALESFKQGVATFIELRTAQQSLADGYNRLINARYLAKVAETELLRLSGGLLR